MLLFLLSFYLHYDLLNSEEIKSVIFNESVLVDKHHQNILQVNSLMRDLEKRFKETSSTVFTKRDDEFVSPHNITDLLRSGTVTDDQKFQITNDPTKPPALFLPSSQNNPYDPLLGISSISPSLQAPPSVIAQSPSPETIPQLTLLDPELRSGLRYSGSLLSPRHSMYPELMMPGGLLPANGPDQNIANFSYSTSSTRTTSKRPQILHNEPPLKVHFNDENPHDLKSISPAISPSIFTLALSSPVKVKKPELRSGVPYPGSLLNPRYSMYPGMMKPGSLLSVNGPGHYIGSLSYSPGSNGTTSKRPQILYKEPPLRVHLHDENPHELKTFSPAISPSISNLALSSKTRPRFTTPSGTVDLNAKIWEEEIAPYTRGRSSSGTANTAKLFNEDEHGFLYVTYPKTTPGDRNKNSKSTIAGDVLYGKIQIQNPLKFTPSSNQHYLDVMEQLNEGYLMFVIIEMCRLISLKSRRDVQNALHHMEMIYNYKWTNRQVSWMEEPLQTVVNNLLRTPSDKDAIVQLQTRSSMMFHMLLERRTVLSPEVNSIIEHADMFYDDEDGRRLLNALKDFEDYPNTTKTGYEICQALMENLVIPLWRASRSPRRQALVDSINKALKDRFPLILRVPHGGTLTAGDSPIGIQPRKRKRKHRKKKRKRREPPRLINTWEYSQDIDKINPLSNGPRFRAITTIRTINRWPTPALPLDLKLHAQRVLRQRLPRRRIRQVV